MAGIEILSAFNKTAKWTNSISGAPAKASQRRCLCNEHFTDTSYSYSQSHSQTKANNYNTKQPRLLTLCLVVMMAFIVIVPHNVDAAAVRRHLSASVTSSQTSADMERLVLLSSAPEELNGADTNEDSSFEAELASLSLSSSSSSSSDSDSSDSLSPLEVAKHIERMLEHQTNRRSSLRKRDINHLENLKFFDGSSHQVEWHNPCKVDRVIQNVNTDNMPRRTYYYLKKFRSDIRKEFNTRQLSLKHIRTDDMETWAKHSDFYSFLPTLKHKSNISLSRWYRNMQTFMAAFTYLGRSQYKWDMAKRSSVSETTKELDQLISSARFILCELETTINGSHPGKNVNMLKSLSRKAMDDKLQFKTKELQSNSDAVVDPFTLDLKFAKNNYFVYLDTMRKILRRKLKNKNNVKTESSENGSEETSNTNASDDSSINSYSIQSDYNMSLAESFEQHMKSQQQPQQTKQKRTRKTNASRKSAELPQM